MKISPNFMKSLSNRYAKASMMNTLKENLEKRQEKTDDYFADMYNTAETKGLPAYEEATIRSNNLKRISTMLKDTYQLNDVEILALAQRPTGLYGSGLVGIEKAITEAKNKGKNLTANELRGLIDVSSLPDALPEGLTFEGALAELAGIYTEKASTDPNAKNEKNTVFNMLSSALSLNPKLNASSLLENANIGGISAKQLFNQSTTIPSSTIEGLNVTYTGNVLRRRSAVEDNRIKSLFKDAVASVAIQTNISNTSLTLNGADFEDPDLNGLHNLIVPTIVALERVDGKTEEEAIRYIKKQFDLLTNPPDNTGRKKVLISELTQRMRDVISFYETKGEKGDINALDVNAVPTPTPSNYGDFNFILPNPNDTTGGSPIVFNITEDMQKHGASGDLNRIVRKLKSVQDKTRLKDKYDLIMKDIVGQLLGMQPPWIDGTNMKVDVPLNDDDIDTLASIIQGAIDDQGL